MRLNLTRTLGATALSGALLIGSVLGATSANAAENTPNADRLEGAFITQTSVNDDGSSRNTWNGWSAPGEGAQIKYTQVVGPSVDTPPAGLVGAVYSFPAVSVQGEIAGPIISKDTGLCLTRDSNAEGAMVRAQTCAGTSLQQWQVGDNGWVHPAGSRAVAITDWGTDNSMRMTFQGYAMDALYVAGLSAPVVDEAVAITGPGAGEVVESATPTFSGTGEPGAEIVVKDGAGNELARTTVAADGTWTVVSGVDVPDGPATAVAEQTINGDTTTDSVDYIVAALVDTPIVAPLVGLGALALAGVAAGGIVIRRKKTTQV